jgi:nucleotide-binding universal stress UspA family protein
MSARITPGSVVVGVDGSRHERWAVEWAARKAARERRPLVLLQVNDPRTVGFTMEDETVARRERRERDTQRIQKAFPELSIHTVFDHGDPRAVLLRASRHAAHLVVGSRGRGPLASLLLGSVSAAVAGHAACPVTVVRPHHPGTVRRGVLVGADDTPESREVLEHAFREASERQQPLTVRHCRWDIVAAVTEPHLVQDDGTAAQDGRLLLAEAVAGFRERYPDVPVTTELARGLPEHTLVTGSERMDLLVVGRHHHSRLERALQSAVATAVVERAQCPVLVVPLDVTLGAASPVG